MDSSYTKFSPYIDKEIKIIVECGSRDCLDAIEMLKVYDPDIIYSFECNPECIETCKQNIQNYSKIELIDKAVYDHGRSNPTFLTKTCFWRCLIYK